MIKLKKVPTRDISTSTKSPEQYNDENNTHEKVWEKENIKEVLYFWMVCYIITKTELIQSLPEEGVKITMTAFYLNFGLTYQKNFTENSSTIILFKHILHNFRDIAWICLSYWGI